MSRAGARVRGEPGNGQVEDWERERDGERLGGARDMSSLSRSREWCEVKRKTRAMGWRQMKGRANRGRQSKEGEKGLEAAGSIWSWGDVCPL